MAGIKAKKWVSKKLVEDKKWYMLILNDEGMFITSLRIPTFDRIALEDKRIILAEIGGESMVGYRLYLNKEEEIIFRKTYQNYIVRFEPLDMDAKTEIESIVWK